MYNRMQTQTHKWITFRERSCKLYVKEVIIMDNNRYELNKELAQMLKGGVIMDVTTPEQARIAQEQAPARSWPWNGSRQIYGPPAAFPA